MNLEKTLAVLDDHLSVYGHDVNGETCACTCGNWSATPFSLSLGVEQDLHRAHVASEIVSRNKRTWFWNWGCKP